MYSYLFLVIISINKFSFNRIQCILCKTLLNFKRICNRYTSSRNTDQYSSSPRSSLFLLYTLIYFSLEYGKYPQTAKLPATINSIKTFVNQSSYTRTQTQTPLRISVSLSNYPNKPFPSNFQLLNHKQPTFASNHPFPKIKQSRLPIVRNANLVNKPSSREPFSTKPFSLPPSTILPNSIFVFLETLVYSCNKTGQSGGSKDIGLLTVVPKRSFLEHDFFSRKFVRYQISSVSVCYEKRATSRSRNGINTVYSGLVKFLSLFSWKK